MEPLYRYPRPVRPKPTLLDWFVVLVTALVVGGLALAVLFWSSGPWMSVPG